MNRRQREFVKSGIAIPLIIAVIITISFFAVYKAVDASILFKEREFQLADYSYSDVVQADAYTPSSDVILKTELPVPDSNAIIGSARLGEQSVDIIYDGNDVNGAGRFNINADSRFIGESGCAYLSCPKSISGTVKSLENGDTVKIDTYYGSYEYKIVSITTADSELELTKAADEYGRCIAVYTDGSDGVGLNDKYYIAVGELVSGNIIKG